MKRARQAQLFLALVTGAGLLVSLPAELAAAPAGVRSNTNLRQGPGTNYGVTATIPRGSVVDVSRCNGQWCTAHWRGMTGYMVASNLDMGAPGPVVGAPPPVYYEGPDPYYDPPFYYYDGPRYRYWGPRRYYRGHYRNHW